MKKSYTDKTVQQLFQGLQHIDGGKKIIICVSIHLQKEISFTNPSSSLSLRVSVGLVIYLKTENYCTTPPPPPNTQMRPWERGHLLEPPCLSVNMCLFRPPLGNICLIFLNWLFSLKLSIHDLHLIFKTKMYTLF